MSLKGKLVEGSTVRLWERVPDYILKAHPGSLMAAIGDRVAEERLRQFVEGLGLDSIDALELGLALQKKYGVSLSADSEETRRHFSSVRALGEFVAARQS